MNQWIADRITSWSLGSEYSKDSNKFQIVSYGILLMIETIYKVIILMILGEIIGAFSKTMAFLVGFCGLRKNAGGIHMKTSAGCMLSVMFLWGLSILGSFINISYPFYVILFLFTLVLVGVYAPCTTTNNPIKSKYLRKKKKVYALTYVLLISLMAYIIGSIGYVGIRRVLVISMALEGITIIHKRKEI